MKTLTTQIQNYIQSNRTAFFLQSAETARVDYLVKQVAERFNYRVIEHNSGYGQIDFKTKALIGGKAGNERLENFLYEFKDQDLENKILLLKNVQLSLENNPLAISRLQYLLENAQRNAKGECAIILQATEWTLPSNLKAMVTEINLPLPKIAEIKPLVERYLTNNSRIAERISTSLLGLNEMEVEQLLNLLKIKFSTVSEQNFSQVANEILNEKEQIFAKNGVLEIVKTDSRLSDIGGLDNLKTWLSEQNEILSRLEEAKEFGVALPQGALIAGMPGCGKSLAAKAAAQLFQQPLLRLDMGSLLGKYVGDSESNMRKALAIAESISPCVLWIDELEKAFVGMTGNNASDVGARLLGYFLTWLQEKKDPVFVIATANDITSLPPELLRKGRFDEIFYVTFPTKTERKKILEIHLRNKNQAVDKLDFNELAEKCRHYAGADIANAVAEAIKKAFLTKRPMSQELLLNAIEKTIPLRRGLKAQIEGYEQKFEELKLTPASAEENGESYSKAKMNEMVRNPNDLERIKLARYEDVPEEILEYLVQDEKLEVRKAAFSNPNCPSKFLDEQLSLESEHSLYHPELLTIISKHKNLSFDFAIRKFNPDSDELINLLNQSQNQRRLNEISDYKILANFAEKGSLSYGSKLFLSRVHDKDTIINLSKNKELPDAIISSILDNPKTNREAIFFLLKNDNIAIITPAIEQCIIKSESEKSSLFGIAVDSVSNITSILTDGFSERKLVELLIKRENLSINIQRFLVENYSINAIIELTRYRNLDDEIKLILAKHSNTEIRKALAKRTDLPKFVQEILEQNPISSDECKTQSNSSFFSEISEIVSSSKSSFFSEIVSSSKSSSKFSWFD